MKDHVDGRNGPRYPNRSERVVSAQVGLLTRAECPLAHGGRRRMRLTPDEARAIWDAIDAAQSSARDVCSSRPPNGR